MDFLWENKKKLCPALRWDNNTVRIQFVAATSLERWLAVARALVASFEQSFHLKYSIWSLIFHISIITVKVKLLSYWNHHRKKIYFFRFIYFYFLLYPKSLFLNLFFSASTSKIPPMLMTKWEQTVNSVLQEL